MGLMRPVASDLQEKAHGTRRMSIRPGHAGPVMIDVVGKVLCGNHSPAQMLHRSPDLRLQPCGTSVARGDRTTKRAIGQLRAAKHRFERFHTPSGRTVHIVDLIHKAKTFVACASRRLVATMAMAAMAMVATSCRDAQATHVLEWRGRICQTPRHIFVVWNVSGCCGRGVCLVALMRFGSTKCRVRVLVRAHLLVPPADQPLVRREAGLPNVGLLRQTSQQYQPFWVAFDQFGGCVSPKFGWFPPNLGSVRPKWGQD